MSLHIASKVIRGTLFFFFESVEEGKETYYYWERQDIPVDAPGHSSFLPFFSLDEAILGAEEDMAERAQFPTLPEVMALACTPGVEFGAEDNAEWMETPDGSINLHIGSMEDNGVWITLRLDGTYALAFIAP